MQFVYLFIIDIKSRADPNSSNLRVKSKVPPCADIIYRHIKKGGEGYMYKKYIGKSGQEVKEFLCQFGLIPLMKFLTSDDFNKIADKTIKVKRRRRVFTPEVVLGLMGMVEIFCNSMGASFKESLGAYSPLNQRYAFFTGISGIFYRGT
jgi:hypothetical protein